MPGGFNVIDGIHAIFYSKRANRMRAFLADVLELPWVDAGGGWPIYAAPPAELAVHPGKEQEHELYLVSDDIHGDVAKLAKRGVKTTGPIVDRGWGLVTQLKIPGGDTLGIYEPRHPRPKAKVRRASRAKR